jgi:hypothetical protein
MSRDRLGGRGRSWSYRVRSNAMNPSCLKCRSVVRASDRRRSHMSSIEPQSVRQTVTLVWSGFV